MTVDVRILAATNVNVQGAIAAKKLREDLYYRLNAFVLHLPPLRERREAIPLLLRHFMARFAVRYARAPLPLSPALREAAQRYAWPGNLRELKNFVKRYLILGDERLVLRELETNKERSTLSTEAPPKPRAARPGDFKSLVRSLKDEAEMEAIAGRWSRRIGAASRRRNSSTSATRLCSTRSANTASTSAKPKKFTPLETFWVEFPCHEGGGESLLEDGSASTRSQAGQGLHRRPAGARPGSVAQAGIGPAAP